MDPIPVLLLRPDSQAPSPTDQSMGVRLASQAPDCAGIVFHEEIFPAGNLAGLEKRLKSWQGKISGVIGATNVPESTRLGELANRMNMLCFVANNNPAVWQARKHVFHIGLPSPQTAAAVAGCLSRTNQRRIFLIYDETEFQRRVASSMRTSLRQRGFEVNSLSAVAAAPIDDLQDWRPDLVYVVFSDERKALALARGIRARLADIPLLFGRSLLRESFLLSIGETLGEIWFVDMFPRTGPQTEKQRHFGQVLSDNGAAISTANHGFGWDAMTFCGLALRAAGGNPSQTIDWLESGNILEGVTGTCTFSRDNHNGRTGFGPTVLTRWTDRKLEEV